MRTYEVTITGKTPILMHADNISWTDEMAAWKDDAENKKTSKAGDDRSPAFRWLGSLYHDGKVVAIPSDNLMTCLREGGAMVPVPGGRGNKTFKSQTQSGMMVNGTHWPILVGDKEATIPVAPILALKNEKSFDEHQKTIAKMGFDLHVKRAKIGQNKHVRVRPIFDKWATRGELIVTDDQITTKALEEILQYAGMYKGLGDWRPGGKTPGSFGIFTTSVRQL